MGAYDYQRRIESLPRTFGEFSILVGTASDWYSRRSAASKGDVTQGEASIGGMVVTSVRPNALDILVNIADGEPYAEWADANPHHLRLTTPSAELRIPVSTTQSAFGSGFGRYRIAIEDRPAVAAVSAGDTVRVQFVPGGPS